MLKSRVVLHTMVYRLQKSEERVKVAAGSQAVVQAQRQPAERDAECPCRWSDQGFKEPVLQSPQGRVWLEEQFSGGVSQHWLKGSQNQRFITVVMFLGKANDK